MVCGGGVCVCVCTRVHLWHFLPSFLGLFNRILLNRTWVHSVGAGVQFLVQPLGVRLDSVLCVDCFGTCLRTCCFVYFSWIIINPVIDRMSGNWYWCAIWDILSRKSLLLANIVNQLLLIGIKGCVSLHLCIYPYSYPGGFKGSYYCKCINSSFFFFINEENLLSPLVIFLAFWCPSASIFIVLFIQKKWSRDFSCYFAIDHL